MSQREKTQLKKDNHMRGKSQRTMRYNCQMIQKSIKVIYQKHEIQADKILKDIER